MANGNLIQGARRIGQARRFVDYGKIIGDNIKSPALTQYFEEARAQYFQNIKEKEAKLSNFINQKAYMDMSKINEYNVDMASDFLSKKKAEYLEAANIAATASVGSDEYVSAVSTMNSVNNCIKNFDVELKAWRDQDGEKTLDFDNNKISKGNLNYADIIETMQKPGGENGPTFVVGDCGKVTMVIKDAEGNVIKELERQDYFLKVTDDQFYKLGEIGDKYYNVGLNGLALDEKRARQDVRRWIGEDHTKLLSLARDDFDEMPAFIKDEDLEKVIYNGLTGRELLQKNNQTELKSFLVDKYIGALKDRHTAGTKDFGTIKAREEKEKKGEEGEETLQVISTIRNSSYFDRSPETGDPEVDLVDSVKTFDRELYADQLARDFRVQQYGGNAQLISKTTLFTSWLQGQGPKLTDSELVTSSPYLQDGFDVTKYINNNGELKMSFYELLRTEEGRKLNDQFNKYYGGGVDYPLYRYENGIPTGIGNKTNFEDDKQVEELLYRNKFITTKQIKGFQKTIDPKL